MIDELKKIQETLINSMSFTSHNTEIKSALTKLSAIIERLGGYGLVEEAACAIVSRPNTMNPKGNKVTKGTPRYKQAVGDAQAVINLIKGK